ncbi:MAG: AmmeMemoRadiSam system protein B, partial [bacterium]|nr:AmmeMemoRadiSam system protein B [bacterium]
MDNRIRRNIILFCLIFLIPFSTVGKESDTTYWTSSASKWFPADANELTALVDGFLNKANKVQFDGELVALISPHAGYQFSGQIAANAYKQLKGKQYDTVILLGLAHRYPLSNVAIIAQGEFETPLGKIEIDSELANRIIASSKFITVNPDAHRGEHSIENQLPFLQRTLKKFKIVPILVNRSEVAEPLAKAILTAVEQQKSKKILIVASTDLSHLQYPKLGEAKKTDFIAISAMESLNPDGLNGIPCGEAGVMTALICAKSLGAKKGIILKYGNSYEITGDRSWVVGYGAIAIIKSEIRNPKSETNQQ